MPSQVADGNQTLVAVPRVALACDGGGADPHAERRSRFLPTSVALAGADEDLREGAFQIGLDQKILRPKKFFRGYTRLLQNRQQCPFR